MVFIKNVHKQIKISTVIQSAIPNQILQNGIFIHPPHLYLLDGFAMNNILPSSVHLSSIRVNTVVKVVIRNRVAVQEISPLLKTNSSSKILQKKGGRLKATNNMTKI
ncbi:unnamed protein product [Hymenolepis diminuta]|uniref:Uncharacterized protein n=1 Tax=Hymenolepis diminuta TaxID=6216 RepID=A0A564YPB2_HYMDI|nr:unnamed protein product [Hymenolepis diminuta]